MSDKMFDQSEFDADARKLWPIIREEDAKDYVPRPFSYDMGDFDPPEKSWQERKAIMPAPEQESPWPFMLEVAFKLFFGFVFIVGLAYLATGPH